jgi:hypothetical protein
VLLEARRNGFLYRSRRAELHREGHAPDYPATVATPWRLACDQLSAPAWALLNLLAWYVPDTIPLDQLLAPDTDPHTPRPGQRGVSTAADRPTPPAPAITELVAYGLLTHAGGAAGSVVGYPVAACAPNSEPITPCWLPTGSAGGVDPRPLSS